MLRLAPRFARAGAALGARRTIPQLQLLHRVAQPARLFSTAMDDSSESLSSADEYRAEHEITLHGKFDPELAMPATDTSAYPTGTQRCVTV